tara:strand:- start:4 stop:111 length:108 start_codon:yes stop_codon:yes gene_type:complete
MNEQIKTKSPRAAMEAAQLSLANNSGQTAATNAAK